MLRKALDAFARMDLAAAAQVVRQDQQVDAEFKSIMRQLITFMMEDPRTISRSLDLLFIAKSIKRIGDHAKTFRNTSSTWSRAATSAISASNSAGQIDEALMRIAHLDQTPVVGSAQNALRETEDAINHVLETSAPVELAPQSAYIRRLQHQMAEERSLSSRSTGTEPYRRVRISKAD